MLNSHWRLWPLTIACLAILATTPVTAEPGNCTREPVGKLLRQLNRTQQTYDVPAYGLTLVSGQDTLFSGARGVTDIESGKRVDSNTRFRIGSITKAFTSLAVMLAANDGHFNLDDKLSTLLDPVPLNNPWESTHPVTLAQLLEHTSGMTDLTWDEMNHSDSTPLPLADALKLSAKHRIARWPPGEHSSYSNAGAGIAGRVLEVHTKMSYEDFVQQRIFKPLGMTTASLLLDEQTRRHLASGYDTDGRTLIPYWHMLYRPFGAINVTTDDMAPFLKLLLAEGKHNGKQLLGASAVHRMEVPETTLSARHGLAYGYGLGIYSWYNDGWLFHGHGGDGDGYLAHFGYNRDFQMAYFVVITAFQKPPLRQMRRAIEQYITCSENTHHAVRAALSERQRGELVGDYRQASWRFGDNDGTTVQVVQEDGRLYTVNVDAIAIGKRRELVPVTAQLFRRREQPEATIAIVPDSNGALVMQGDIGNFRKLAAKP